MEQPLTAVVVSISSQTINLRSRASSSQLSRDSPSRLSCDLLSELSRDRSGIVSRRDNISINISLEHRPCILRAFVQMGRFSAHVVNAYIRMEGVQPPRPTSPAVTAADAHPASADKIGTADAEVLIVTEGVHLVHCNGWHLVMFRCGYSVWHPRSCRHRRRHSSRRRSNFVLDVVT